MTFVHPLLLGGLLLVGIPVLLHLMMRQKPKHLLFPAFRFLLQRHKTNQRKLQLRHLLLLALRMLLLAAICLALARPKILQGILPLSSDRPVAAVLIFDTSYSMEYVAGGRSRLDEAKRRSAELLDDLPDGSRVAVLDTGEPGGEWLPNVSTARARIDGLQLRPANYPVTNQIPLAYDLLAKLLQEQDKPDEAPVPFLYVLSDRTQACWDARQTENLQRLRDRVPRPGVNAVFVDVGVDKPEDVGITELDIQPQSVPANQPVTINARVQATGAGCDGVVVCRIDGEKAADRKPVKLAAGQSTIITFERLGLGQGMHQAEIALEPADNALLHNNLRFATVEVRAPRRVLIVADDRDEARPWQLALESGHAFVCDVKSTQEFGRLGLDELGKYQVVTLFEVDHPGDDLWDKLQSYVQNGGGLAVIPGAAAEGYNTKAAKELLPGELVRVATSEDGAAWNWKDTTYQHSMLKPFLAWNRDPRVDFVKFPRTAIRYWQVQPYPGVGSTVVSYADKGDHPALLERLVDRQKVHGRVLLFTTALGKQGPRWNNYLQSVTSFYVVLAQLSAGYLAGDAEGGNFNYPCGQVVPVPVPAGLRTVTYTIEGPGFSGADAIVQAPENQGELRIQQAVLPGNYKLHNRDNKEVASFSLNVSPEESQLGRLPVEPIEALFGPNSLLRLDQKANFRDALQNHWSQPIELFPWLMILLLLLLAVENLLANKFYRREPVEAPGEGV